MSSQHTQPVDSFVRLRGVQQQVGLSRTEIYRRMADGRFPRSVSLGPQSVAWLQSELTSWIAARISERNNKPAA